MLHQPTKRFQPVPQEAASPCHVADLAKRFNEATNQWEAIDANQAWTDDGGDAEAINEMMLDALKDAAALHQATSALGALFQVCIAGASVDHLGHLASDENRNLAREDMIRLECALWSVRRFLESQFDVSADSVGGEYLMGEHASYLTKLAKACAPRPTLQAAE